MSGAPIKPHIVLKKLIEREMGRSQLTFLGDIENLLKNGVEVNAPGKEPSALTLLLWDDFCQWKDRRILVDLLIEHGANPMSGDQPFDHVLVNDRDKQASHLLLAMAKHGAANPQLYQTIGGSNPLHVLADASGWSIHVFAREEVHYDQQPYILSEWINGKRAFDGRTPLHCLWQPCLDDFRNPHRNPKPSKLQDPKVGVWKSTKTLVERGADLLALDKQGQHPLDMIMECFEAGMVEMSDGSEGWAKIEALHTQRALEAVTAAATSTRKPARI